MIQPCPYCQKPILRVKNSLTLSLMALEAEEDESGDVVVLNDQGWLLDGGMFPPKGPRHHQHPSRCPKHPGKEAKHGSQ
jgi:hypothetical protein